MKKSLSLPLLTAIWLLLAGCVNAADTPDVDFDNVTVRIAGQAYQLEYAQTFRQRATGLMYRRTLCEDCGMLFRFSPPKQASMWMKNTYIPLDVAFIDKNGVITDIKALKPHDLTSKGASKVITYALEMNQGWFAAHDIAVGDKITITPETDNQD
ncbi:DUF192 domain-containing protein [Salinimonas chungwhensis]|uniref:DUF192 domain-containing protein n=1 Tax=Salinimonas chungwhensis TaxID=265425 RepID=UPI00059115D3|nr:DUF192 domain-containing protein [Salinimonas chungwhensis]